VGSIFSGSVVASTNFRYSGGSSSVLSMALNVLGELVRLVDHEDLEAADAGLVDRLLEQVCISSMPRLDAASSSV
jgi:hypothetical protein